MPDPVAVDAPRSADPAASASAPSLDRAEESTEQRLGAAVARAAVGVAGVHSLGGVVAQSLERASRAVLGATTGPGVTVSRDDSGFTVDLDLVVEYPHRVRAVVEETRRRVVAAARPITSERVAVDITVADVHGPFDPEPAPLTEQGDSLVDRAKEGVGRAAAAAGETADQAASTLGGVREAAADALEDAADAADEAAAAAQNEAEARERSADRDGSDAARAAAQPRIVVETGSDSDELEVAAVVVVLEPSDEEPAGKSDEEHVDVSARDESARDVPARDVPARDVPARDEPARAGHGE